MSRYNRDKHYFAQAMPIYSLSPDKHVEGVLVMTASTEAMARLTESVGDRLVLFQVILVLVLVLAAVLAAAMMVRPFKEFQAKLHHVEQGALDTDISSEAYRETRDISNSVAQTITKLQWRQTSPARSFVSNVSHELKTPITSIRVLADSLMGMGEVPVELYRSSWRIFPMRSTGESKIIDDLLSLVKMDKSEAELNISQVNLNVLVEQILKRLRPIANRRKVELIFESIREVTADVDEMKLSLAITNLVENAIKYNMEEGWVRGNSGCRP
ncbi:MAG: sensor histidine kinase [Clostridium sp.]